MAAYVVQITQANGPDTVTLDATSSPNVLNVTDGSTFASLTVNANTASPLIVDPDPTLSADLDLNGNDITGTGNITTTGDVTLAGNLTLRDNDKAIFGASSDLSIYHDGSNSYIEEAGAGALKVTSNGTGVDFESAGGETLAQFVTNGAVTLYHNNNQKLATTSTGIDVTGTVKSTVSSTGDFNFNAVSSGGGNYRIYPDDATTANPTWLHQSNSSEDQAWVIGGVERMRLDSSGNVGIATASPAEALDVTGNAAVSGKAKVGAGVDGHANADELVISKDINNVGMSLLAADATGVVRLYLGSQTDTTAAKIQHSESNERLFLQAKGDLYFQTGGTNNTMTLNTSGDLDVTGALSKGSGSFKISHPLKPDTHHLVHSFIEGPQADNIYRGTVALVDGTATVNLDTAGRMTEGTFVALNGNVQCFTTNEQGWIAVRGSVSGNLLTIEAQDATCTDTVSWLVIGERHDQHMIDTHWTDADGRVITEPEKPPVEEEDTE